MTLIADQRRELEAQALKDYHEAFGTIMTVRSLTGYQDDGSYDFDGPEYRVRVVDTPENDLYHWCDEYLDPYWNVELVEPMPDELKGYRNFWTYGQSYKVPR
jgi:hypothetical protein